MEILMIGETILHYKILKKLGEEGMGIVYKAEDIKIQAAASLNHPNIATIFSIEEVDDGIFSSWNT
jgi:serine/threonine protein kinase